MFFGSLFSAYVMLRAGSLAWPDPLAPYPWVATALLLGAAAAFGSPRIRLIAAHAMALAFVWVTLLNALLMMRKGLVPSASLQLALWFTLTGAHGMFVLAGAVFTGWMAGPAFQIKADDPERWQARLEATQRYWIFLALLWLILVGGFYVG